MLFIKRILTSFIKNAFLNASYQW